MNKDNKKRVYRNFSDIEPKHAFLKGWGDVKQKDIKACQTALMDALGIRAQATFYRRLRGQIVPTVEEYQDIVHVFAKFGVKQPFGV